jgi:hypothetical protein
LQGVDFLHGNLKGQVDIDNAGTFFKSDICKPDNPRQVLDLKPELLLAGC